MAGQGALLHPGEKQLPWPGGGGPGGRRKWVDSRYILKVEPLRFADKLNGVREKEKSRMTPKPLSNWKDGAAIH